MYNSILQVVAVAVNAMATGLVKVVTILISLGEMNVTDAKNRKQAVEVEVEVAVVSTVIET